MSTEAGKPTETLAVIEVKYATDRNQWRPSRSGGLLAVDFAVGRWLVSRYMRYSRLV